MTNKLTLSKNSRTIPVGLEFQICYKAGGNVVIERIRANCHADAVRIANQRGECIRCEYIHTATDLLYIH